LSYKGSVNCGLMNGRGEIFSGNPKKLSIVGEFSSGLITQLENMTLEDGTAFSFKEIQDKWDSKSTHSCKMVLVHSKTKEEYNWDCHSLKHGTQIISRASRIHAPFEYELLTALEALNLFQTEFLINQSAEEEFTVEPFQNIIHPEKYHHLLYQV